MNLLSLEDACLRNATFECAVMEGITCMCADFTGANLCGADLYWAVAAWAVVCDADLTRANLQGSDLKFADFTGARLIETNIGRSNLGGGAELQGANLAHATIVDSIFDGCEYDSHTRFPVGFAPEAHGMALVEDSVL